MSEEKSIEEMIDTVQVTFSKLFEIWLKKAKEQHLKAAGDQITLQRVNERFKSTERELVNLTKYFDILKDR